MTLLFAVTRPALSYTNRLRDVYFLHAGKTKTGKLRYFVAKTVGEGVLAAMPAGFEFSESINGVVSVRRIDPDAPAVPEADLGLVRAEVGSVERLRLHRVEAVKGEIVIYEPGGGLTIDSIARMAKTFGMTPRQAEERLAGFQEHAQYSPVLKFVPCDDEDYAVHRMTYRGDGGWSWELARGALAGLAKKYVKVVGTEQFFDLM